MSRLPFHAFTLLGVVLLVDLALTVPSLAEPVATHFDGTGKPNGWMTQTGYAIFMANASRPPALPHTPFLFMLGCFLAGMAVWTVLLWRRFRKPS